MNPYYKQDGITIYHGDCLDAMSWMDRRFDLVVTSPPYNMGLVPGGNGRGMYRPGASSKAGRFRKGYGGHTDDMPQAEYDKWQRAVLLMAWSLLEPHGAIFYNHRPRIEHGLVRLPLGMDFGGLPVRQIITWDRGTGIDVNLRHYCTVGEWIIVLAKPGFRLVDHSASGVGDVWRLGMAYEKYGHPAPFPLSLPLKAITTTGARSVLDPFMGSGTTMRAAKDLGIAGVGIELEEAHCETAAKRLMQSVLPLDVA